MKSAIWRNVCLFFAGFCMYITIETVFRGYSYPLMGICGGILVVVIDKINNIISWDVDLFIQSAIGSLIITAMEFVIGTLFLNGILPMMWDYSNLPLNYNGIICVPFSIIWLFMSCLAIFIADAINYYVYEELPVPYYKIFGKTIIKFKEKECKL